jgi:hypothetical protein
MIAKYSAENLVFAGDTLFHDWRNQPDRTKRKSEDWPASSPLQLEKLHCRRGKSIMLLPVNSDASVTCFFQKRNSIELDTPVVLEHFLKEESNRYWVYDIIGEVSIPIL